MENPIMTDELSGLNPSPVRDGVYTVFPAPEINIKF